MAGAQALEASVLELRQDGVDSVHARARHQAEDEHGGPGVLERLIRG